MGSEDGAEHDEDLQKAIAMSLENAEVSSAAPPNDNERMTSAMTATKPKQDTKDATLSDRPRGILGLDRKAMERERLARAATRKRDKSISPPPSKRARVDNSSTPGLTQMVPTSTAVTVRPAKVAQSIQKSDTPHVGLRFPKGVIRKTYATYHPADERSIKIEDIIDKHNVRTAILSTFMLDPDWILPEKFDLSRTKFYMILHAKSNEERVMRQQDFEGLKQARLCLPRLTGAIGCQHSKLMLLFFTDYVRIALPSANLVDFDWGETGLMENSVFLIDLPRLGGGKKVAEQELPFFGQRLLEFLKNQDVSADVREGLLNFDFAATAGMAFVHTSEGSHFADRAERTALPGLSTAVRELGLDTDKELQIDFASSSVGSLNDEFINTIYEAAQGKDITTPMSWERRKQRNPKVRTNLRVYFPTHDTVTASIGGPDNGGTICMQKSYWDKDGFPREIFRDYKSSRQGLLSHNKLLFVRGQKRGKSIAWVYVGSANCSGSAWGNLVTKGVKLNCNNWESGVVLPVEEPPDDLSDLGKVFESVMDVPFEYGDGKGLEYGDRRPWFYMRKDRA